MVSPLTPAFLPHLTLEAPISHTSNNQTDRGTAENTLPRDLTAVPVGEEHFTSNYLLPTGLP